MNRNIKNIAAVVFFALLGTSAIAQVSQQKIGQNPLTINSNAALEIESSNKGLLLPRLELQATNLAAPLIAHVQGMTVYNTAEKGSGETAVTPGYYYNDGTQWVRIADATDIKKEPWYDQATNAEATLNTQNIYQMGSVAVGTDLSIPGVVFDARGVIRGGVPNPDELDGTALVGANSIALGNESIATGENSVALGVWGEAFGEASIALGGTATGPSSFAVQRGYANGSNSTAFMGTATGYSSFAAGRGAIANAYAETVFGSNNAITNGNPDSWVTTDALFQIGNGIFLTEQQENALTILKNGNTAIGVIGENNLAKPTERLDIGLGGANADNKGSIRIRAINTPAYTGNVTTDKVVVADATGVLKTVAVSTLAPEATEPWYNQADNTQATANTQDIYQMGSVAIGKEEVYEGAALDVKGAIRAGADHQGEVGQYSAAFGLLNEASGTYTLATGSESIANGDHAISMGYMTIASGNYGSIAVGNESIASGQSAVAMGNNAKASNSGSISLGQITDSQGVGSVALGQGTVASTHGEVSVGIANAITTGASLGIVPTDALFQIGNGSSSGTTVFSRSNAVTVLKNAHTGIGIAGTESDAKPTEMLDIGSKGVRIRDINTAAYSGNSATDNIVVADPNGVLKTLKAAMPKFFYMPSIIVPTSEEQLNATGAGKVTGDAFNDATRQGTIQLHTRYAEQFGLTGTAQASSTGAPALPVLPADELHYYVTWYDINVFETVSVSNTGVLTYTVKSDADITIGSFMNIVFAVKEDN